ncbi:MAG: hypothetical protein PHY42_00820 [Bacilli bacterium]|nr:hypothetical protein [Bacilli bacterium]
MKKVSILLLLITMFLFSGCKGTPLTSLEVSFESIRLINEGLEVTLKPNSEILKQDKLHKIGIAIGCSKDSSLSIEEAINVITIDFEKETDQEDYIFLFENIDESFYNVSLTIQPYLVLNNEEIEYLANHSTCILYQLAKQEEHTYSEWVVSVVEEKVISEIRLTADYQNYTVQSLSEGYQAILETDYNYITITITILDDYLLRTTFQLIINDTVLVPKNIQPDYRTITYMIDDPNWTQPY